MISVDYWIKMVSHPVEPAKVSKSKNNFRDFGEGYDD